MDIRITNDYGIFSKVDGNRDVIGVNRLINSIKALDLTKYNPIIVDESFRIIDGQHRFEACRILQIPIYYVVIPNDIADKAMILLNQHQKQWRQENFLRYHSSCQGGCYKELEDFNRSNNLGISNNVVIFPDKAINASQIRIGKVKFGKNPNAVCIVDFLNDERIRQLPNKICRSRAFVLAIRKAFEIYGNKQINKIANNAIRIPHCADYEQYLTVFKNILKQ